VILIDSNVLIDVLGDEQIWRTWSIDQLAVLAADHQLAVNQIAFAEVAPKLGSLDSFNNWLDKFEIGFEPFGDSESFHAGQAFNVFRARHRHGERDRGSVLADFFIGGHAQVAEATILTRDPRFYRTYFPSVPLITPDKAD
jgi:predicted nucleic acid-binding protein